MKRRLFEDIFALAGIRRPGKKKRKRKKKPEVEAPSAVVKKERALAEAKAQAEAEAYLAERVAQLGDVIENAWAALLRSLHAETSRLASLEGQPLAGMVSRMLTQSVEDGLHARAWVEQKPLDDPFEADDVRPSIEGEATLPLTLERSVAAFTAASSSLVEVQDGKRVAADPSEMDEPHRDRSRVALFLAWTVQLLDRMDEVAIPAAQDETIRDAVATLRAALAEAGVHEVSAEPGDDVDLERHRIMEHRSSGTADRVQALLQPGASFEGEILRKADVAVGPPAQPSREEEE